MEIHLKLKEKTFKSSLTYSSEEVNDVLQQKILEESLYVEHNATEQAKLFESNLLDKAQYISNSINVLSLFSGAGGLDLGVQIAHAISQYNESFVYEKLKEKANFQKLIQNINIVYSNDLYSLANETYLKNIKGTAVKDSRDIRKVINFPQSDLILGGFPCPGFSAAGPRLLDDPRNFLYIHYIRALVQSRPAFFIAENVKGLMTMAGGQVLAQIKEDFSAAGYVVTAHLVNARDYGVPQLRERVFIIGVRKDISEKYNYEYELPKPTHGEGKIPYVTLKDAIGDLPRLPNDVFISDYSSMYMSRNRKKTWNEQSFTIQASGRQAPQHPEGKPMKKLEKDKWVFDGDFNRRLSVRECARIQTFPDWFEFATGDTSKASKNSKLNEQYKQIGNAVPVVLADKISRPILSFLASYKALVKK